MNVSIPPQVLAVIKSIVRYRVVLIVIALASLYGYLFVQINSALSVEPTSDTVVAARKKTPRIDQETVDQLKQLQDNSVSVKALFNEARTNPFE